MLTRPNRTTSLDVTSRQETVMRATMPATERYSGRRSALTCSCCLSRRGALAGFAAVAASTVLPATPAPAQAPARKLTRIDVHRHFVPPGYVVDRTRAARSLARRAHDVVLRCVMVGTAHDRPCKSKDVAIAHSPSKTGVRRPYGPPYKTLRASAMSCHTRGGESGSSHGSMPNDLSAEATAFVSAPPTGMMPPSPAPLAPSGLFGEGCCSSEIVVTCG